MDTDKYEFELDLPKNLSNSTESERRLTGFDDPHNFPTDGRNSCIGEASEIYGDYQTAEEFGYVMRGYVGFPPWKKLLILLTVLSLTVSSDFLQAQVPAHPIHRSWWDDWNRSISGNWESPDTGGPIVAVTGLPLHWRGHLRYDAFVGRDGHLATLAWSNPAILLKIRRSCHGFCRRVEQLDSIGHDCMRRNFSSRCHHIVLEWS